MRGDISISVLQKRVFKTRSGGNLQFGKFLMSFLVALRIDNHNRTFLKLFSKF